jgi:hypothetical protein
MSSKYFVVDQPKRHEDLFVLLIYCLGREPDAERRLQHLGCGFVLIAPAG